MRHKYIDTVWEVWSYDVWGNDKDGFDVNNRFCDYREYPLRLRVEVANADNPSLAFEHASPTDKQIKEALGIKSRVHIETDGDDLNIYVRYAINGYPLGELICTSHESLSPIRPKEKDSNRDIPESTKDGEPKRVGIV